MTAESDQLRRIRARLAAIEPGRWSRVYDGEGCFVEAAGPMGELLPVLRFHPGASDDEIAFVTAAPDDVRFLLGLVDRAIDFASRVAPRPADADPPAGRASPDARSGLRPSAEARGEPQAGPKNYAAECAMKCGDAAFKVFLEQRHGLERPLTGERAAQKVRSLLGVTSRRELNGGGEPARRWVELRKSFEARRVRERSSASAESSRQWRGDRSANAGGLRSNGTPAGGG